MKKIIRALAILAGLGSTAIVAIIVMISPAYRVVKSVDDIYGTYLAENNMASEKLVLSKDGTFTQELTFKATGKHDSAIGKWSYGQIGGSGDGYVTFNNQILVPWDAFGKFDPDYKKPKDGSGAALPAERFFGNIYLGSDKGVLYKKQ